MCKGIVLGLYRLRDERDHDLLSHAEDFPDDAAGRALAAWSRTRAPGGDPKGRRQRPELPHVFVKQHIPDWKDLVDRALRPARR